MTRRVKTHIRLGIRSVSPSDKSPRSPLEETLGPYLTIAKFRGVSPRSLAELLHKMSRSFAEKTLGEITHNFIFLREKFYFVLGVFLGETQKKSFFCMCCNQFS